MGMLLQAVLSLSRGRHTQVRLGLILRNCADPCTRSSDAQGDLLRGLQVVETATNIPTALLGDTIEG